MRGAAAQQVRDRFKDVFRLTPLMAAVLAATAVPAYAQVAASANALTLRQGVGQTATSMAVNGLTTNIRTNTIQGSNAFNSFTRFEVGGGNTVNLHLPTGTSNLVNLVSDSAVRINGTVNSLLASGRVGGNVVFADPYGFVVGASGVLNVGGLTVSTPSLAGMDRLLGAVAGTDAAAVADLQAGRLGFSTLGGIRIEGRINALDSVSLQAGDGEGNGASAIDVSGTVRAGGAVRTQVAVNVGGSQAIELVQSEGRIVLSAGGDIKVTGKLSVDGDPWAKAGAIRVTAGRDLTLGGTAQISASNSTGNNGGGDVYLWGERNVMASDGVRVSARAAGTGDGGQIEISGRKSIDLGKISFDASSTQGKAGEVLIDPDDLTISDVRVSAGTNFSMTAADSITVSGSVTTTSSSGNSGNITLEAPRITLTSTGLLDASASAGYTAGDVTLTASKPANIWFPSAESTASININGVIKGKNITASADARVNNGQTVFMEGLSIMTELVSIFAGGMPLNGAYIPAKAEANIDLSGTASLTSTGNVVLKAYSDRKAIYTSNATSGNFPFAISVLVGKLFGSTTVNVGATTSISAGGSVDISAASNNVIRLIATAVSGIAINPVTKLPEESTTGSGVGVAATISMVDTSTTIDVATGSQISGTSIAVLARAENSQQTETTATAFGANAALGAALTVALNKNAVSTKVGGTLTATTGDINLGAVNTFNDQNNGRYAAHVTKATTEVVKEEDKLAMLSDAIGFVNDDGSIDKAGATKAALLGGLGKIWETYGATKSDKASTTTSSPIKAAAAVVFDQTNITSAVEVLPNAVITASSGVFVAVANTTTDLGLAASSTAESKMDDPASASSKLAVSAGIVVGAEHQTASVLIGNNARITAERIGLSADNELPLAGTWTDKWVNITSLQTTLAAAKRLNDTVSGDGFQSNVNAEATGDAEMAIAGAVMVVSSDASASTWVDHHATLTATLAVPAAAGNWTAKPYEAHTSTGVADDSDWSFGKSVNVVAANLQRMINVGGNGADVLGGVPSSSGKGAVGATFNWLEQSNKTIAGIGDFVTVTAPSLAVNADVSTWMLAISPTAGSGGGVGLNGVGAMIWMDNTTHASISKKALVNADEVEVVAGQSLSLWSATGSFSSGTKGGVGLAIAYSDISADTRAFVGDNSADHPGTGYTTAGVALGSEAAGLITTDSLKVEALSEGVIGTVSVSLAAAGSKPAGSSAPASGSDSKASGPLAALTSMLAFLPGMSEMSGASSASAPASGAATSSAPPEPPPKFSIAAAGAAAVTITNVDTVATIDGATVQRKAATGVSNTTVLAVSNVNQISVAGGGAFSMSADPATKSNTGVGVAISLQMNKEGGNGNETRASIVNSTLTGQGADHVEALSGGDLISVGIGATGQFSKPSSSNYALAGSVSVTKLANVVSATVTGSTLTAASGSTSDLLNVVAYDRTRVGTGGGALTIGGSKGAGAAITYTDLGNKVHAGISGSTVTDFETVNARALSGNRIIAGALVATVALKSGTTESTTIGGAAVINQIANTVSAAIEGTSSVTGATTVAVTASGAPVGDTTLDALIGQKHDNGVVDLEATNSGGGYSDEFKSAAQGGDAIIGVAGAIQVSSSSVGLSYVGNIINNTYDAAIDASTVTASGVVSVTAKNTAKIIGVAAGLGVSTGKFAGVGSATSNIIGSNVTAAVRNSASVTAGSLSVDAGASSGIISVAGSVAISTKGNAGGAALTYNQTGARSLESGSYNADTNVATRSTTAFGASGVQALVDHSTVNVAGGTFAVQAQNTGEIKTMAATGTVAVAAGGTAVSGALTWNDVGDTAKALVNTSTITATSSTVQVGDSAGGVSASISSLAGALAISGGGSGFGGAFAINQISSTRSATAVDSTFILTGPATFDASSSAKIQTLSAAIAASKDSAMGVSFGLNMIDASLEASTSGGSISGATSVNIHSHTTAEIGATSGAVNLSLSGSAMGGAISTNLIGSKGGNAVKAGISGGSVTTNNGSITVNAEGTQTIGSIAVAGSGSASLALAGSASANTINTAITSKVSGATLDAGMGDVFVDASDNSSISSMAPALAVGGSTAVGVSIAVNRIGTATTAGLSGGSVRARDLILDADESASIKTIAIGVGAGGSNGGAGSVVVNILTGSTTAKIEDGADVLAQGDVAVLANESDRIEAVAGALAIGLSASALGAVSVTNLLQNTTDAHIAGATTKVSALSLGGRSLTVKSAILASAPDLSNINDVNRAVIDDATAFATRTANGVVVNATALQRIGTVAVNISGSGGPAAVALLASVDAVSGSTTAYIENATINSVGTADSSQTVDVQAANHAMVADFSAGAAVAVGGGGVNATVASVSIDRSTDAHIKTGTVKAAGAVKVNARSSEAEVAFSFGVGGGLFGGVSANAASALIKSTTLAYVGDESAGSNTTSVQAGSLDITARADNMINLIAGGVAGGAVGIGASVGVGLLGSTVKAYGSHLTTNVSGALLVSAHTENKLQSVVVNAAAGVSGGASFMVAVNIIGSNTEAFLNSVNQTGSTPTSITVAGIENLTLGSYGGALGAGGSAGLGVSANVAIAKSTLLAEILNSSLTGTGDISVTADRNATAKLITATAGLSGGVSIAGSVGVVVLGGAPDTSTNSTLDSGGNGTLTKADTSANSNRTGESNGAMTTDQTATTNSKSSYAVKSSVNASNVQGSIATVVGSTLRGSSLTIRSDDNNTISNGAGAVAVGLSAGAGAGIAVSKLGNTAKATMVSSSATVTGNVSVSASNDSNIETYAVTAAVSGGLGFAASIGVNQLSSSTQAGVSGGTATSSAGSVLLNARSSDVIKTVGVGVAVAGGAAAAGSVVVNTLTSNTSAFIDSNATVTAYDNVGVLAFADDSIEASGGAMGVGIGAVGIGAVSVVNTLKSTTDAHISGAGTVVTANANTATYITEKDLTLSSTPDLSGITGVSRAVFNATSYNTRNARGLVVNAASLERVGSVGVNVAASLGAAAGIVINVDQMAGSTKAYIDGARTTSGQDVDVRAADNALVADFATGVSIGGLGAGNGALNTVLMSRSTQAYINGGSTTASSGAVAVNARSTQAEAVLTAGLGGGAFAGVSATSSVGRINSETLAYVNNNTLSAASLDVRARGENLLHIISGSVGVGFVGVGGSVGVAISDSTVKAYVDNSSLSVTGALGVNASTVTSLDQTVVNMGAGVVGVGIMAGVALLSNTTEARLENVTQTVNASTVTVAASDSMTVSDKGGSSTAGAVGVGVAVNVLVASSRTDAKVISSTLKASGAVNVNATRDADLQLYTMTASAGAVYAVSASVGVIALGQAPNSETNSDTSGSVGNVNSVTTANRTGDTNGAVSSDDTTSSNTAASYQTQTKINAGTADATTATITGGSVTSAGLTVSAAQHVDTINMAGGVAGGYAGSGAGAAVAVTTYGSAIQAGVSGTTLTQGANTVTVQAVSDNKNSGTTRDKANNVISFAGGGGTFVGLGAAVGIATNNTAVNAGLAGTVTAGAITVSANDSASVQSRAVGAAIGAGAIGVARADATNTGSVTAELGGSITTTGAVNITASRSGETTSSTVAGAAGIIAGAGADSHATSSGNVTARINDSANINGAGQVVKVSASDSADANAEALAATVATLGTVGVSTSTATLNANVTAKLGSNVRMTAAELGVASTSDGAGVSYSTAAGGGLLFGANAVVSQTNVGGAVLTQVGGGSVFNVTGDVNISAADTLSGKATSSAFQLGFVAAGAAVSNVTVTGSLSTDAGGASGITGSVGGSLNVSTSGQESAEANATAGSGGVIAGAAAVALTDTSRTTSSNLTYGNAGSVATAGAIYISAEDTANVTGHVDSLQASLVGAAGGSVKHIVSKSVAATLGNASNLSTHTFEITSNNAVAKPSQGSDVSAGSGGLVGAAAALSTTNITGLSSLASIGNNAHVTVTGSSASPGSFNVAASNEVDAVASVKLFAAGLVVGAGGEASINATGDSSVGGLLATAAMGTNSSVDAFGNITFSALSRSNVDASASTSTYGLAAAAQGDANAKIANTNNVTIGTNSTIAGTDYVSFLAGVDKNGRTNVANATSSVDLYNKTAFPISITPSPTSEVDVNNNITINASSVRTAGTVYLTTEDGTRITKAKGVGKDLYTEALKAVGAAFGVDLNLELTGGNASHNYVNGVVTVNGGTIEAGANNIQRITFDENGNVVTATKLGNISYTKSVEDLAGNGVAYLNKLYGQRAEFGGNAQIEALITYYEDQLVTAGFAEVQYKPDGSSYVTARDSVPSNFITVNDVYAKSGNIVVAANRFGGTGSLIANADNEITIINNSPYQLRVKDLIIDSTGGFIKFNASNVRSNADITALNPSTGSPAAAFGKMESIDPNAGVASVQPIITLSSTWSPALQADCTSDADCDAKLAADPLYEDRPRAPDIRVAGHLYNRLGAVNVTNANGSVIIAPDIAGYTPLIEGATTSVSSGRQVFLDSPSAFTSIGGDPKSLYLSTFTADDATRVRLAGLNGNVCATGDVLGTASNPIATNNTGCYHAGTGGIFGTTSVFLSAKYLNINGTVQSGQPDWSATLDASNNAVMDARLAQYKRWGGSSRTLLTGNLSAGIPNTYYNAATDRIEMAPTAVTGGNISLVGYALNTGGGQIKAMDGRGHITLTNNTNRAIDLLGLDAGDVSGKVVITDLGKSYTVNGKTVNAVTTIKSSRDASNVATYTSVTTKGQGGEVVSSASSGSRTGFSYSPVANSTYSWLSGFSKSVNTYYYWKSSSYLWGASGGWDKGQANESSITGDPTKPPIPLVEAEYVNTTTPGAGNNFNITWRAETTANSTMTGSRSWHKCGFLCFKRTNYRTENWTTGKKDYFTTSVRADHAIPINFIGYDSGSLDVTSLTGNINIAGAIINKFGAVNLTSTGGMITQSATAAQITADSINLISAKGVGTPAAPINAQVLGNAGGTGFSASATSSGNIVVNSTGTADLRVGKIVASVANGGNVTVNAYNGIIGVAQTDGSVNIEGAKIELHSTVGAIGSAGTALTIKTRDDSYLGGLTATAAQDINIKQTTGNLWLNTVASTSGNVTIEAAAGSLYDGNHTAVRDQRTYDELLGAWNKMSLRSADSAANNAALQVQLDAVKIRNNQAYKDYWAMRGAAAYNPDFQYSASASEISALGLDTSAKLTEYNGQKTSLYQTTHARLAVDNQDATFNPSYSYVLTAQETGDLSSGSKWSDAELATSMPKGLLFKENTNSITLIKENNVSSNLAVTLKASGTIGRYDGQMIIDPRTPMSDDQKVALTAAETKDVSFQYFNGTTHALLGTGPVALSTAISTRDTLQAKKNAGGTLTSTETTDLANYSAMNLPSTGGYNKIAVNLNSALNTKSSLLTVQANSFVYLSSLENNINIKSVTSGLATGDGNIRVTSLNNIYNVAGSGVVAISGRGAILEAANGVIGTAEVPLLVDLGAGTLTARSAGNMYITQSAANTMNVAQIYSPSNVFLSAASGIRDARGASPLAIKADNITLTSSANTIGTAANPLAVATVDTSLTGGVVNATASAANMGIYLTRDTDVTDTTHELRIGTLSAKGDIEVSSLAGLRMVGPVTGGTTTSHHLTLQAGRDLAIDGKVTETGTLSVIATGNPATVTQFEAFQANALSLSGSTAAFSFWQPGNQITKLAADVGSLTLRDLDGYLITSVTKYPTMAASTSTLNGITANGGVYLTAAPMLGAKIVTIPTVTQDQRIVAGSLNLYGNNAVFTLGLGANQLRVGSDPGSLTGKVSALVFASNSAYKLSDLTGLGSLSLAIGAGVTATGVATVSAASPLTTPLLTLNGPGSFDLFSDSQNVAKLQTGSGALGLNTLAYRADRSGALGALVASSSITLSTTGSLAQLAGTTVVTPTLTLQGVSGSYDLAQSNNDISNLVASTGNIRLRDDNGLNVTSASLTGILWLQSTSNVTQSAAITASQLDLNGTNADYQFGAQSNAAGTLKGATTTVTYKGLANYAVGPMSFSTLDLSSTGTVSQAGALTGTTLTLRGTGQFQLGNLNNTVGTLSNVGNATAIDFLGNTGFTVGALSATALTLQSDGVVTQTAAITAPTLVLDSASTTGDFRLSSYNNALNKVSGSAGALSVRDDTGFVLGALSVVNQLTLVTAGSSAVTQSAAIRAGSLQLGAILTPVAATDAFSASGVYTLNAYANSIGNLWGTGTSLALWDATSLVIGGGTGLGLTGGLTLQSTANVTATATNLRASALTLVGTTGTYDLTAALNATSATSMFGSTTGTGASLNLVQGAVATVPAVPAPAPPTPAVLAKARG
jgi:hypothetical protein